MDQTTFLLEVTDEAREHLKEIATYIALDNPERAESFSKELFQTARALAQAPYVGSDFITRGGQKLRSVSHGNYLIIYKVFEDRQIVEIWAFWHGARRPPEF